MKNLISSFIANDLQISRFSVDINKSNVNISLSEGIHFQDIERINSEFNLIFVSILPYQKFSGASWISLYFKIK